MEASRDNRDRVPPPPADAFPADTDRAIRLILDGTAAAIGTPFFRALVCNLAGVLGTAGAWVTEYLPHANRLRALAFWFDGDFVDDYEYHLPGTPCEDVVCHKTLVCIPDRVTELFPDDPDLAQLHAVSYMGLPLLDQDEEVIGHLAVLDSREMPLRPHTESLFRIFAARAGAEMLRLRAEDRARAREEQLVRLVDSAMDAIVELDSRLCLTRVNRAFERTFGCSAPQVLQRPMTAFLESASAGKFESLTRELAGNADGAQSFWIPGGLRARRSTGETFPAEGSLSLFESRGSVFFTLILRDLNEKLAAEQKIYSLESQAEYLREELDRARNFHSILGRSTALRDVLQAVRQVAPTNSTVLILGETGTGKELVARAIHAESRRHDRPLIRVNCAAMPATLIESELFGHEKGAFTGATLKREGRFALADGGTIFLDEVGELPIELQAKLLRVLQEGEFEAVGSSTTRRVDVRVIAATNRDLQQAVRDGEFREDLFYRLNVFPVTVPPLRARGRDVLLLAESFAADRARAIGRTILPLSESCRKCLLAYDWPGNVRELQNVIERAVITAHNGQLNLARLIATTPSSHIDSPEHNPDTEPPHEVLTAEQLRHLERRNIERALARAGGKLSGTDGAAALLGIPPSTLASRMKALGISRP